MAEDRDAVVAEFEDAEAKHVKQQLEHGRRFMEHYSGVFQALGREQSAGKVSRA